MYLHLGRDVVVDDKTIVAIFDLDKTTIGKVTKDFLKNAQIENRVVNVSDDLPKSFIVCENNNITTIYISQISAITLLRRSKKYLEL